MLLTIILVMIVIWISCGSIMYYRLIRRCKQLELERITNNKNNNNNNENENEQISIGGCNMRNGNAVLQKEETNRLKVEDYELLFGQMNREQERYRW